MSRDHRQLLRGAGVQAGGTLVSRVLGMLRDSATAALLGLSGSGGVMDAFALAFRIPNLFRRLFGEGALTASFLPVLTDRLEHDRTAAWQLASVMLTLLTVVLVGVVLVGELICAALIWLSPDDSQLRLLAGFTAALLPYLVLICLAAQLTATLQALGHFGTGAWAPALLNVCWLAAAWWIAPEYASDKSSQAYILTGAILIGGVLQMAIQLPLLRGFGFRYDWNWAASRDAVRRVLAGMSASAVGLAITQLNTLADSLLAWGLAAPTPGTPVGWLGGIVNYPLQDGAVAALYYGERLYQFPLGLVGVALGTAIFPLLSRHAARGDFDRLGYDLTLGLRLIALIGVPASVGLVLLANPITALLFEWGEFTAADASRTARVIACYGAGVWAYCGLPVLVRAYHATGSPRAPVRIGMAMVGVNLALNLILIWPLAEAGLAVATAVAAALNLLMLSVVFARSVAPLDLRAIAVSTGKTVLASAVMAATVLLVLQLHPAGASLSSRAMTVLLPCLAGAAAYFAAAWMLGVREMRVLWGGSLEP